MQTASAMKRARAIWPAAALLAALGTALAVAVSPQLSGWSAWLWRPQPLVAAAADPSCDLRLGPCRAAFPSGGEVHFGIAPRTLPVMQPLTLTVALAGLDVTAVEVDFAGRDMDMGFNRVGLAARGDGLYLGEGMLPLCTRERMAWEARVMLHRADGLRVASFRFETQRGGP